MHYFGGSRLIIAANGKTKKCDAVPVLRVHYYLLIYFCRPVLASAMWSITEEVGSVDNLGGQRTKERKETKKGRSAICMAYSASAIVLQVQPRVSSLFRFLCSFLVLLAFCSFLLRHIPPLKAQATALHACQVAPKLRLLGRLSVCPNKVGSVQLSCPQQAATVNANQRYLSGCDGSKGGGIRRRR